MQPGAESLVGWEAKSVFGKDDFFFLFTDETPIFLLVAMEKSRLWKTPFARFSMSLFLS